MEPLNHKVMRRLIYFNKIIEYPGSKWFEILGPINSNRRKKLNEIYIKYLITNEISKLSIPFIIRKILELIAEKEVYEKIRYLDTLACIEYYDNIWKSKCEIINIKYIPSIQSS